MSADSPPSLPDHDMLRVAYDITSLTESPFGGIAQVCQNTVSEAKKSSRVTPIAFYQTGDKRHCAIEGLAVRRSFPLLGLFGRSFHIAHSLCHRRLKVNAKKAVFTVYDAWSLCPNRYQPAGFQRKVGARLRRELLATDYVVTVSEHTRSSLLAQNLVRPERCSTVYPGVDMSGHGSSSPQDPQMARLLQKKYVLFVGCLEIRKNVTHVLEAVRPIQEVDLLVVGQPGYGYKEEIEARLGGFPQDRLYLFPRLSRYDLGQLYKNAVATLLPSWEEGFGLPIIEAMRCSCPVITSDRSANAEISGDAAILIDPVSPRQSRHAIEALLDNAGYRDRITEAGLSRAKRFGWAGYFGELVGIYDSLLS